MPKAVAAGRWRVREGEEARLASGTSSAAEIRSRGPLPLRVRQERVHHARPGFPGSAVVLGDATFEVVAEDERAGEVVYALRSWPEGEVVRHRVVYGPAFIAGVDEQRARQRLHALARPWKPLLSPLVGSLPEPEQLRACERLGLDPVFTTCVSGLAEATTVLMAISFLARHAETGMAVMMVTAAPGLVFLVLPGLGRAASAVLFRETAGSPLVSFGLAALRAVQALRLPAAAPARSLTRARFWAELAAADTVDPLGDGAYLVRGRLPHLGWTAARPLQIGDDFWRVVPQDPERDTAGWVYGYRLEPAAEPAGGGVSAPPPTAYADEVLGQVRSEWDGFNRGFAALTSMLSSHVQARAFAHRGGPAAARSWTFLTSGLEAALAAYLFSFLPGPPADPVAPAAAVFALALAADAVLRTAAGRAGRYAPSLLRVLLPSNVLRPERAAYQAHRQAERRLDAEAAAGDH
ncbi:MAG TPA: hypothetical protein VMX54_13875 [Vicinamibacteria bacterium]|nr:hypothetical protein [Vicinamibacteria bacterium]